jgi:hypothetical protein
MRRYGEEFLDIHSVPFVMELRPSPSLRQACPAIRFSPADSVFALVPGHQGLDQYGDDSPDPRNNRDGYAKI